MGPDVVVGLLVPGLIAFGAAGMVQAPRGKRPASLWIGIGPFTGFLVAFVALAGGLPFVSAVPHRAVGEAAVLALLLALGLRIRTPPPRWLPWLLGIAAVIGVICAFRGTPFDLLTGGDLAVLAVSVVVALLSVPRIAASSGDGAAPVLVFAAVALSLGFVALVGGDRLDGNFALALAAATIGWLSQLFLLRSTPHFGPELPPIALLLVAIAVDLARTSLHPAWPVLLLVPALHADRIVRAVPFLAKTAKKRARRPLILLVAALIPGALAVVAALLLAVLHHTLTS